MVDFFDQLHISEIGTKKADPFGTGFNEFL